MIMALLIVSVLLFVRAKSHGKQLKQPSKNLLMLIVGSFVLTLIQFGLGVDVRQFIDYQIKQAGSNAPQLWLDRPEISFTFTVPCRSLLWCLVYGSINWWLKRV